MCLRSSEEGLYVEHLSVVAIDTDVVVEVMEVNSWVFRKDK
jgi:hypothetical protein